VDTPLPGVLKQEREKLEVWLSYCEEHGVSEVLEAFDYYLNSGQYIVGFFGTPMMEFCTWGRERIKEMQQRKANATNEAATSPPSSSEASPSPSELANMGPCDQAYEQALVVWRKEHPDQTRSVARKAFENDDEYINRVLEFFQDPQTGV
jgi:hypothetical protein